MESDESTHKKKEKAVENDGADEVDAVEGPEIPASHLRSTDVMNAPERLEIPAFHSRSTVERSSNGATAKGKSSDTVGLSTKSLAKQPPPAHPKDDERMMTQLKNPPTRFMQKQKDPNVPLKMAMPANHNNTKSREADGKKQTGGSEFQNDKDQALQRLSFSRSQRRQRRPRNTDGTASRTRVVARRVPGSGRNPKGIVPAGKDGPGAYTVNTRAPGDVPAWVTQQVNPNQEDEDETKDEEATNDSAMNDHSRIGTHARFSQAEDSFTTSVAPTNMEDDLEEQSDNSADHNTEKWFDRKKIRLGFYIFLATLLISVIIASVLIAVQDNQTYIQRCNDPDTIKRTGRYLDFKSALEFMNVTGLDDPCTPRTLALAWLADNDNFEVSSKSNAEFYQRYAMVLFYVSANMNSTILAVQAGKLQNPWLTDDHVCLWTGVTCSNSPKNDTVTGIELSDLRLSQTIPNELVILVPHLKTLNVFENDLTGTIPVTLYSSSSLANLNMGSNRFSGLIDEIEWTTYSMEKLNLAENQFSGPIPGSIGSLTNLVELDLSRNNFAGPIPSEIFNLPDLYKLNLQKNSLSGSLPITLTMSLAYLNLESNIVGGKLPLALYNLTNLVTFSLDSNEISGTLSQLLGNLHNLEELLLARNQITGMVPNIIAKLSNLKILDLSKNIFKGSIPGEIGNMGFIERLFVDGNNFSGTIPSEIGMLTNLLIIEMNNNNLDGSIPSEIGQLTRLQELNLSYNDLTQDIPIEFGMLSDLHTLRVAGLSISTQVPAEVCKLIEENLISFKSDCAPQGTSSNENIFQCDCCTECRRL